ncbi:hypothetical protein GQ600_23329 [Phytophthora cactorum]|nr:hypothetical protein GQ600_23329 [Phytophthora cactorum]
MFEYVTRRLQLLRRDAHNHELGGFAASARTGVRTTKFELFN